MKFVIRLHAEITIKSKGVRKRYGKVLVSNLKNILKRVEIEDAAPIKVLWLWDRIEVNVASQDQQVAEQISDELRNIPGIAWFSRSHELTLNSTEEADFTPIAAQVLATWGERLKQQSFAVRVNRKGKHGFRSMDLERYIGGAVLQNVEGTRVELRRPTIEVRIEVDNDTVRVFGDKQKGLGGFPLPTQETVVSLLSGGFDSSVASFQLLRRGARTHFCFFNLGGDRHETGVRQTAYYLWNTFASSHPLKFISIDFAPVVEEILAEVDNGLMGVVLKRQMLRTAQIVARRINASALVTGEALGQVSSQTLSNLSVIDEAIDGLVLRPLITMDKQEIINIAEHIGTADIARSMPEYCGVISIKPTVKAQRDAVAEAEAKLDPELLQKVVRAANVEDVRHIGEATDELVQPVSTVDSVQAGEVIIDIRSLDEQEARPLGQLPEGIEVTSIPFFKLATAFAELDKKQHYLLYCEKGVMSKLQALYLQEQGYNNVGVYQPPR
ncbi:tRNA sulfurtransferase [Pseudidiomarina piscicola]|uniref:tRNA sulfurtransferase n=1 Tax=Pseudidiomarina piscicola TaxID=2614830 RepID=A0A6S6WLB9_9GAMM|nr:tRNA uracil 4-sulfurtransferase ThiI [Pseudidiomarina piscicola]CAB0151571.1 tRNA sulfurtransferase [Pseudidiomarina piscicola]VZT41036.1 tRNA sulfurtransferase [Pseudomonas aeruginosa]